ncbi:MAG: peptidyl-prolyl cis-trans isomerase [Clostridia bacterium]|nr:peptidyl-prolyl cis-trans isomerase [Clostridia bacterium]
MSSKNKKTTPLKAIFFVLIVISICIFGIFIANWYRPVEGNLQANEQIEKPNKNLVIIDTNKGTFEIELYPKLMPKTVANFEKLVDSGFYNNLTFHRVEDWVVQGGDPLGNGTGGPGWTIELEVNPKLKNVRGAVGMARSLDPNSAGSQFYILKKDAPGLDGQYAVFGKVVKGMEIVDRIQPGDKMNLVKK